MDRQPEPAGYPASPIGLAVSAQGRPVLVYREHVSTLPERLRRRSADVEDDDYTGFSGVVECLDAACSRTRDERLRAEDPTSGTIGGADAIDATLTDDGRLVVVHYVVGGYRQVITTCRLERCGATGVSTDVGQTLAAGLLVERNTVADVEIGADGRPIAAFLFTERGEEPPAALRVVKCVSPDCSGTTASNVVRLGSAHLDWSYDLALGRGGDPMIAFFDYGEQAIEVLRCTRPDCTSTSSSVVANLPDRAAEAITLQVGAGTTIVGYVESVLQGDRRAARFDPLEPRA